MIDAAFAVALFGALAIWRFARWRGKVERKRNAKIAAIRERERSLGLARRTGHEQPVTHLGESQRAAE